MLEQFFFDDLNFFFDGIHIWCYPSNVCPWYDLFGQSLKYISELCEPLHMICALIGQIIRPIITYYQSKWEWGKVRLWAIWFSQVSTHSTSSEWTTHITTITMSDNKISAFRLKERHVTCPFDKSHSILPERLAKHIFKCKKNNEEIASRLIRCPYSSVHYLEEQDYFEHVQNCPRKFELQRWFGNVVW